jgi:putative addiction module CopG family antidote
MNVHLSEQTEQIIRSQDQNGRYSSEEEVIEEAVRQLADKASSQSTHDDSMAGDQALQIRLHEAGIIGEIKPPITDASPWQGREAVPIEGEPLSEMILRERR